MRTGIANLPLHGGKAPRWLFERMTRLAREIVCHLVAEHGPREVLLRLADPYWFQAFGFDWHSSGVTTTACGAVKEGIKGLERDLGLYAAGGKDGTPYPVARERYDRTIDSFHDTLSRARLGDTERRDALKRLGQWAQRLAHPPVRPAARD